MFQKHAQFVETRFVIALEVIRTLLLQALLQALAAGARAKLRADGDEHVADAQHLHKLVELVGRQIRSQEKDLDFLLNVLPNARRAVLQLLLDVGEGVGEVVAAHLLSLRPP